jgi:hypothetical protein
MQSIYNFAKENGFKITGVKDLKNPILLEAYAEWKRGIMQDGGELPLRASSTEEGVLPTSFLPEVEIYPNIGDVSNPMTRASIMRAQGKKPGNYANEVSEAVDLALLEPWREITGINAAKRIYKRGAVNTLKDIGKTVEDIMLGSTPYSGTLTPEPEWDGLQSTLDVMEIAPYVGGALKLGTKGLQRGFTKFGKSFALDNLDDVGRQVFNPTEEFVDLWRIQSKDFKKMTPEEYIQKELKTAEKNLKEDIKNKYLSKINLSEKKNYNFLIDSEKRNIKQIPISPVNKYYGRWYTDNPKIIDDYINLSNNHGGYKRFENPEILHTRVPKSKLREYNVGEMAKKEELLHYQSKDHVNEFIVPKEYSTPIRTYEIEDWYKTNINERLKATQLGNK